MSDAIIRAMLHSRAREGRAPNRVVVGGVVIVVAALTGCASHVIRASRLPASYQATPTASPQDIDLSWLALPGESVEHIEPGDVLQVTVGTGFSKDDIVTVPLRVGDNGVANVPLVGDVPLAGLELEQSEQVIHDLAIQRGMFRSPQVTVVMQQKRANHVTVVGAVKKPGTYDVPRNASDLLAALVQAGGLDDQSAGTAIEIRRMVPQDSPLAADGGMAPQGSLVQPVGFRRPAASAMRMVNLHVDLEEVAQQNRHGVAVQDGDVVMVMNRVSMPVNVIGLVQKPGQYELTSTKHMRVLDAIALAGGLSNDVADKVYVIRRVPSREQPVVVQVSLATAKSDGRENLLLAPGDVVSVEQTMATVTLEALKNFVRFGASASIPLY